MYYRILLEHSISAPNLIRQQGLSLGRAPWTRREAILSYPKFCWSTCACAMRASQSKRRERVSRHFLIGRRLEIGLPA